MSFRSSSPVEGAFEPNMFAPRQPSSPVHIEDDVPSDVDASFASGMSLCVSRPASPLESPVPMDISPVPTPPFLEIPRRPALAALQPKAPPRDYFNSKSKANGDGAGSSSLRAFGTELSNLDKGSFPPEPNSKRLMLPPPVPSPSKRNPRSRAALPTQWLTKSSNADKRRGGLFKPPPSWNTSMESPARSDAMDVDMSSPRLVNTASPISGDETMSPPPPVLIVGGNTSELSTLYEAEPSPAPIGSRRMPSPTLQWEAPSSSPPSSPTLNRKARKMDKFASTGGTGMLFGAVRGTSAPSRRSHPYPRRPSINPFVAETDHELSAPQSAFAILTHDPKPTATKGDRYSAPTTLPVPNPMRRAYSMAGPGDPSSDELDGSEDGSPLGTHVQKTYARRNHARIVPQVDGTSAFRPARRTPERDDSSALLKGQADGVQLNRSPYGPGGLPGFGDNEADGKILPCHKVKDDGLMRITTETMEAVLSGGFSSQLTSLHIVDCRFDYEFKGGHIAGAINLNSIEAIEEYFLGEGCGEPLPEPSHSGQANPAGSTKKMVVIFHCEFSAKRAPTFAKHLRSRDRAMNTSVYPNVHYPEVYILSGGYCEFYKHHPARCEPRGYVAMNDPAHTASCSPSLNEFRRWQRARSYTYGEVNMSRPKEGLSFAAAAVAVGRRAGLSTLDEDGDSSSGAEDTFGPVNGSPCPLPPSAYSRAAAAMAAPNRPKSLGRVAFERAVSFRQ